MATAPSTDLQPTLYQSSCEGKERHPSEAAARAALEFYQAEGALRTCSGLAPYHCHFCLDWHLGHVRAYRGAAAIPVSRMVG
jgi:hypothetical protein